MTWHGLCPDCRGALFVLTVNSAGDVHVNCANEHATYIGKMRPATILHPPVAEAH